MQASIMMSGVLSALGDLVGKMFPGARDHLLEREVHSDAFARRSSKALQEARRAAYVSCVESDNMPGTHDRRSWYVGWGLHCTYDIAAVGDLFVHQLSVWSDAGAGNAKASAMVLSVAAYLLEFDQQETRCVIMPGGMIIAGFTVDATAHIALARAPMRFPTRVKPVPVVTVAAAA